MIEQALANKVDRDPHVLADIEEERRWSLARAYAERVLGGARDKVAVQDVGFYVQQALANKLDRDPRVLADIDASRRSKLAVAYLEPLRQRAPKITADQTSAYYSAHLALFRERDEYQLREVTITVSGDKQQAVRAKLDELGKNPLEVVPKFSDWLRIQNLQFHTS